MNMLIQANLPENLLVKTQQLVLTTLMTSSLTLYAAIWSLIRKSLPKNSSEKMPNGACMTSTDPVIRLVICDAGPIIHLDELGCLDLLSNFAVGVGYSQKYSDLLQSAPSSLLVAGSD